MPQRRGFALQSPERMAIRGIIETTGRDRFSYAERVRFNEALRHA